MAKTSYKILRREKTEGYDDCWRDCGAVVSYGARAARRAYADQWFEDHGSDSEVDIVAIPARSFVAKTLAKTTITTIKEVSEVSASRRTQRKAAVAGGDA